MAKHNGGNGRTKDPMLDVLRAIHKDIKDGFAGVNKRLDNVLRIAGGGWRDHEARLKTVERKLGLR